MAVDSKLSKTEFTQNSDSSWLMNTKILDDRNTNETSQYSSKDNEGTTRNVVVVTKQQEELSPNDKFQEKKTMSKKDSNVAPDLDDKHKSREATTENSLDDFETKMNKQSNNYNNSIMNDVEGISPKNKAKIDIQTVSRSKPGLENTSGSDSLLVKENIKRPEAPDGEGNVEGNIQDMTIIDNETYRVNSSNSSNKNLEKIDLRDKEKENPFPDEIISPPSSRNSIVTASTYGISEVVSAARVAKRLKARRSASKGEYKESILI